MSDFYLRNEAIAYFGKGLDEARITWVVFESSSNLSDALRKGVVGDGCIHPDG